MDEILRDVVYWWICRVKLMVGLHDLKVFSNLKVSRFVFLIYDPDYSMHTFLA